MLAYVFWHWPTAEADRGEYEKALGEFHRALASAKPQGFLRSAAFRLHGAPWLPAADAYEDWYLLEGSAALDVINEAAVTAGRKESHDRAARHAAGGAAGLYRLRAGSAKVEGALVAYWLAKPPGTAYDDFYSHLRSLTDQPGVGLWGRQMVLGPTPEFCLRTPKAVELPANLAVQRIELDTLYSST